MEAIPARPIQPRRQRRHGGRHGGRRAGALLLGGALALVAAEIGLRVAGAIYLKAHARGPDATGSGAVFACVGDSNTFGLYLSPEDSYPAQLERLLADAREPVDVLNLGVPGMGLEDVLERLDDQLARHRPRAVLLLCGVNNTWSRTWTERSLFDRFLGDLRLVKLARLVAAHDRLEAPPADAAPAYDGTQELGLLEFRRAGAASAEGAEYRLRNREGELVAYRQENAALQGQEYLAGIARCTEGIAAHCRARGAALIVLTYPFTNAVLEGVNAELRAAAAREGAILVDLQAEFRAYLGALGQERLLFPDLHPRASGAGLIAHLVRGALQREGLIDAPAVPLPAPEEFAAPAAVAVARSIEWTGDRILARGSHGDGLRVLLSTEPGSERVGELDSGLGASPLLEFTRAREAFELGIGSSGTAELALPAELLGRFRGQRLHAVALYGTQTGTEHYESRSTVISFVVP